MQSDRSYYSSYIDDSVALAELESQSDDIKKLANLDFSTSALDFKPKKGANRFKTITELTECYEIMAVFNA